eukprot:gene24386-26168_t
MNLEALLIILIVGGVAGWLAGLVLRGSGYGILGDIIVGLLGSVVGSYLVSFFHISINLGNPLLNEGIVAFAGAVVLLVVIGILRPRTFSEHVGGWWRRR